MRKWSEGMISGVSLPDEAACSVLVSGCNGSDDGVNGGILMHFKHISGLCEDGRLVRVLYNDFDRRLVHKRGSGR